jgi:large subunit ribosomal protein L9
MAVEVLLMDHVEGLGRAGDSVTVADGFARNYLFRKNLAAPVTDATRRRLEKKKAELEARETGRRAEAQKLADRLAQISLTIPVKAGEAGKMFGSVTPSAVLEALAAQDVVLDKGSLQMDGPLRELGVFNLPVKLHPDVETEVKVWIVEE